MTNQTSIGKPILVSCEESQAITSALIELGYDAWSNDLLPTRGKYQERHLMMDARLALKQKKWHGLVAHPVCRAMANSGAKHLYIGKRRYNPDGTENPICPKRWAELVAGAEFFNLFFNSIIPVKAIENSIMHGHAKELIGCGQQDQTTQPWWFGDELFKAACWWLKGLPVMERTSNLKPPKPGTDEHKKYSECFYMAPGPDRERDRAVTPPVSAYEYARQWGPYLSGLKQFQNQGSLHL